MRNFGVHSEVGNVHSMMVRVQYLGPVQSLGGREQVVEFLQAFPIAIIDEDYEGKHAAGRGMRQLAAAIEKEGFRVVAGISYEDARRLVKVFNIESCWLVSVDGAEDELGAMADPGGGARRQAQAQRPAADLPVRR